LNIPSSEKINVTGRNFRLQEENSCHRMKLPVTGRNFLSKEKLPVTERNFMSKEEISSPRKKLSVIQINEEASCHSEDNS
jgi:hypothetical protein